MAYSLVIGSNTFTDSKIVSIKTFDKVDKLSLTLPESTVQVKLVLEGQDVDLFSLAAPFRLYVDQRIIGVYNLYTLKKLTGKTYSITGRCQLATLSNKTINGFMANDTVQSVVQSLIAGTGIAIDIDSDLAGQMITGWVPDGTIRQALQQVCFVVGAILSTVGSENMKMLKDAQRTHRLDSDDIKAFPKIEMQRKVSAIKLTLYAFSPGTPSTTDKWVGDATNPYIYTCSTITMTNPDWNEQTDPVNEVNIAGATLVNSDNAAAILARVAETKFGLYAFNGSAYLPSSACAGDNASARGLDNCFCTGFLGQKSTTYGANVLSDITIENGAMSDSVSVTLRSICEDCVIKTQVYHFVQGSSYMIEPPAVQRKAVTTSGIHTYNVYETDSEAVTGTANTDTTVDVTYTYALRRDGYKLIVYSISDASLSDNVLLLGIAHDEDEESEE